MRQTTNAAPAGAYGPAYSISYQYFANGAVRQVTYPAAAGGVRRVVNYELGLVGRPVRVCNGACAADKVAEIVAADGKTGYAAHGAVGRMALGNGVVEANVYNSQLQWRQQTVTKAGGLNFQITLGFGGVGRNNGNVASQRIVSGGLDVTQQYTYTQRNQLDTAVETPTGGGGVNWQRGFGYDLYGNQWVSAATPADATPFLPQSSGWFDAATNRLKGAAATDIQYSAAGEMIHQGGWDFTYSAEGQMSGASLGTLAKGYYYDSNNRRVRLSEPGKDTYFVYGAEGELLAEYSTVGAGTSGRRYYTTDWLGSMRLVTDASGAAVSRRDYLPYGQVVDAALGGRGSLYGAEVGTRMMFTGKERDGETGLDYFGARYLSGVQGRWTSADLPLADQHIEDPQSWNMFAYVRNNPFAHVDPNGKACSALNNNSGYCQRAELYGNLDMLVGSKTRFFAAASAASQQIADVALPGSSTVTSAATRNFLETTGQALEKVNLEAAGRILSGQMTVSPEVLDRAMVTKEQTEVQSQLKMFQQSNPEAYGTAIKEINTLLNGGSAASRSLILGANVLFGSDKAYSNLLTGVRKELGRDIDFSDQKDREAIGNALVKYMRAGGCDVTDDKVKCK